ncbi:MAG: family 43 glycosylhydrolase [Propionicimonas sp.]|uniref:glycoside hydrolase family 43 protein n=1 Tax=Propionicimonas sp. TaxID=1955623 RepID=UPI003D0C12E4
MTYSNPIVRGHAPDPSVVRVGEDWYLVNSSFTQLPGLPIRHSRDLVNWEIVGHAVTRPSQYRKDGQAGPMTLFAPTLRHHEGTFYLVCTNPVAGNGNFLLTTDDPAGEWSDAVWIDEDAFDPSLFCDDDGTWYYTRRSLDFGRPDGLLGPIVQATIDVATGELGELRTLTDGGGFVTNDIEGPHLFRRGEWYYLTAAEGSSWKGHLQSIGRSRSPWGPFEPAPHNPILTHRDRVGHPIQSVGHADLVEAADGSWWAFSLGTRHAPLSQHHNIGRETFLTPMTWTDDGWPVIGDGGHTELEVVDHPELPVGEPRRVAATLWNQGWVGIRRVPANSPLPAGNPIEVAGGKDLASAVSGVGALLRPQTADDQRFTATFVPPTDGAAGIAAYTDASHHYSVLVSGAGSTRTATVRLIVDDLTVTRTHPLPGSGELTLTIVARPDAYHFLATADGTGHDLGRGSARLLSAEAAEWFVATHFALVHVGDPGQGVTFCGVECEDLPSLPPTIRLPF